MSWLNRPKVTTGNGNVFSPGPLADLGDVTEESYRLTRVTTNLNAEQIAGELVYDEAVREVYERTGRQLQNPYRLGFRERYIDSLVALQPRYTVNPRDWAINKARGEFDTMYWALQREQEEAGVEFDKRLQGFNFDTRVRALVREREARLGEVSGRASDFDAFVGTLAGGFGAAGTDPATYATAIIPFGSSRTVLGAAVKGAIGNAAIEAGFQPAIAGWHAELGLEYDAETAVSSIVFAALFGGALEGGGSAAYRAVRGSPEYRRAKGLLDKLPEDHTLRQALSGKRKDVIAAGRKLRGALDGVGRFALDAEEASLRAREQVPEGTRPREHETALGEAERAAARDEPPPRAARAPDRADRPELKDLLDERLADTQRGRDARDLARLSDEAFADVRAGRITPEQGALVSRLVPDEAAQAGIVRELAELGPMTPAQSRVAIGTLLEARAPGAAARALGGEAEALARQRSEVAALDRQYAELSELAPTRAEVDGLRAREAAGTLNAEEAPQLAALVEKLERLRGLRDAYDADYDALSARQAAERDGRRMAETRGEEPDPDAEAVGQTFEEMLGEGTLTPEDLGRVSDSAARPRAEVTDFRAEADAIDQLAAPDDARGAIRMEAEAAFGEAAARIIADDPGTDQGRVYLFRKEEGGDDPLEDVLDLTSGMEVLDLDQFIAFHGTLARFDEFEAARMGSGEGAQAFGPGHYFTQSRAIANWYRKRMKTLAPGIKIGKETFNKADPKHFALAAYWKQRDARLHSELFGSYFGGHTNLTHTGALQRAIQFLELDRDFLWQEWRQKKYRDVGPESPVLRDVEEIDRFLEQAIAHLKTLNAESGKGVPRPSKSIVRGGGNIYTVAVTLPADATIQYDLPFGQQPVRVQEAFRKAAEAGALGKAGDALAKYGDETRMGGLVAALKSMDSEAMKILRAEGVRGVRYLDGMSRGKKNAAGQSFNYVAFADSDVKVLDRQGMLFRKTGAKPGKTWMTPIDITAIREDAAVLDRALDEAAACAAGFPLTEGALGVAGGLAAGVGGAALIAQGQARQAEAEAQYGREIRARKTPFIEQDAARREVSQRARADGARVYEAHKQAALWRQRTLEAWREDLNRMDASLPQYRLNKHVEDLTGVRADFLDTLIQHESAGDWAARNPDSTATGGGQFIDSTWREMMRKYGGKYGHPPVLKGWTDEEKAKVMALRTDPRWGTVMTAEYALENARTAEAALGRPITQKEGYLAHFLGVTDFVKLARKGGDTIAADVLPRAASANMNVFYFDGDILRPRTTAQMFALQGRRFSNDPLLVPASEEAQP